MEQNNFENVKSSNVINHQNWWASQLVWCPFFSVVVVHCCNQVVATILNNNSHDFMKFCFLYLMTNLRSFCEINNSNDLSLFEVIKDINENSSYDIVFGVLLKV